MDNIDKRLLVVRPAKAVFYFFITVFLLSSTVVLLSKQNTTSSKLEIITILAIPTFVLLYIAWTKNIITLTTSSLTLVSLTSKGIFRWSQTTTLPVSEIRLVEVDNIVLEVTDASNNHYLMKMSVFTKGSIIGLLDALKQNGVRVITHF